MRNRGLYFHTRRAYHATNSRGHDKRANHDANYAHRDSHTEPQSLAHFAHRDSHAESQPYAPFAPRCWP